MITDKCKQAYETLGLDRRSAVKEIQKAFRNLSRKNHPDQGGDMGIYQKILDAYAFLNKKCSHKNLQPLDEIIKNKPAFQFGGFGEFDESRIKHEAQSKDEKPYGFGDVLYDLWNGVVMGSSIDGNDEA